MRIHLKNARNFGNIMIRADKEFGFKTKGKLYAWVKKTLKVTLSDQTLCNYRLLAENWPKLEVLIAKSDNLIDLYSLTLVEALKLIQKTTRKSKKPRTTAKDRTGTAAVVPSKEAVPDKEGNTGIAVVVPSNENKVPRKEAVPGEEGNTGSAAVVPSNEVKGSDQQAEAPNRRSRKPSPHRA